MLQCTLQPSNSQVLTHVRQLSNERMGVGHFSSLNDLLKIGVHFSETNIFFERQIEKYRFLTDDAYQIPQPPDVQRNNKLIMVDLPQPLGPTMATFSPVSTSNETSFKTTTPARGAFRIGKAFAGGGIGVNFRIDDEAPTATETTPINGAALPKPNDPVIMENRTTKTVPRSISPLEINTEPYLKTSTIRRETLYEERRQQTL
uniref:Uncharacterized protein n=1 Tax=Romanomermis culicivorax TaxID=13658 RepID=A0A915IPF3_ROMCU